MFRAFVTCLMCAIFFSTNSYAYNEKAEIPNFNFEVTQVISETKVVANLIKEAGGEKDAGYLLDRVRVVEEDFRTGEKEKLLVSLQALRAEVLRRHAFLNIALAALIGKENSATEIRALQFINRVEYMLKSIEKRINKIRGDR